MTKAPNGHVWLVGAGPGDPGLITVAGLHVLRRADVVVHDRLASAELLAEAPAEALLIDAGKAAGDHTLSQEEICALLVKHGLAGRRVVRLKGGDPYVFGRGGEEAMSLAAAGVPCTVVPGISSAIGGLSRAGIPVTHRGVASSFAVVTGHEDPTKPASGVDLEQLALSVDTIVVLMGASRLEEIARALISGGRPPSTPAAVVQWAATPDQRTVTAALDGIADAATGAGLGAPALLVVGDVAALQPQLDPRSLAPLAGLRVLVTRTRQQASTLVSALRAEGAYPIELPAIQIEERVDDAELDRTLGRLREGCYTWVVFTSANAVDRYIDLLAKRGADARVFAPTRICAVGPATADALRGRGLIPDLVPPSAVGESVVEALLDAVLLDDGAASPGGSVLLPRAEGARETIPEELAKRGVHVDELTLYLAAPPSNPPAEQLERVRGGGIDVVTFTSSSTVRNLVQLLGGDIGPLRATTIASIGPQTSEAVRAAGLVPDIEAQEHTVPGLLDALRGHFWRARIEGEAR